MSENGNGTVYTSRKWKLILLIVILATLGAFLPPLVSAWLFGAEKPLVILSGTEWVSVITLVSGAYLGANVWQKYVQKKQLDPTESGVQGDLVKNEVEDDANKEA
jgi:hypothetical protein